MRAEAVPQIRPDSQRAWPFGARLMLVLSGLVTASGLVILFIGQNSAIGDARAMSDRLFREVAQRAADSSRGYLQRVIPLIDSLAVMAGDGALPLEDSQALAGRLLPYLKSFDGISWISYADDTGRFVGVQRLDNGFGSNISSIDSSGRTRLEEAAFAADGSRRVIRTNPDSGYDPRQRPFFQRALAAPGQAVWLDPYIFYGQNVPGITCAKAVRRPGGAAGVFTIDFTLDALQRHLERLRASDRSVLCVFTETGKLIAAQSVPQSGATTLPTLADADPKLATLLRAADASRNPFDLQWGGETYFALSLPFEVGPGQRWVVGVVAPASDFLAGAQRSQRQALLACAAALLAALTVAGALARRVSRPVKELTGAMRRIGDGDLEVRAAVGGAREFRQLSESLEKMVADLRDGLRLRHSIGVAMEVQQRLLPVSPPTVAGLDIAGHSQYCDETGGDYYDFLAAEPVDSNQLMVIVGDVMGHGIGAALMMASVRAVLRDRAKELRSLGDLLNRLNELISRDTGGQQFMTMQILIIDTQPDGFRYASAGHDAAIVYRAATDSFDEPSEGGMPLGILEENVYGEYRAEPLGVGDIALVGTDGVWEMRGPDDEMFGKDILRDIMRANATRPCSEIAAAIDRALSEFRKSQPMRDDVTFVLVKRVVGT